jgi:cobalamin biosynthesis Mg chelatase CobN
MGNVVSFEEEEPSEGKTVRLPIEMWNELAQALEFEKNLRRTAKLQGRYSLNRLMVQMLRWALEQYWEENGPKPEKMTDREAILRALEKRVKAAHNGEGGKK